MEQPNYRQALIDKIEVPVEQGEVTAGSVRTTYLSAGSGPPVVCIHGAAAGAVTWYKSIAVLAKHFRVIVPDVVGYGESDKPKAAYDRPYFAAWLCEFLIALGIQRAHIMGNSQGGAIGLQFALENPDRVEKLVLVDSGALGKGMPAGAFIGLFLLNNFPSALAGRQVSRYVVFKPENYDPDYAAYTIQVAKKPGGNNVFMQGRGAAVSPMAGDELRRIEHQTLIIWGEQDNFFPIAHGEAAAKTMPNATLHRIQAAGHLPFLDQPTAFNAALLQFLTA
ncbi:MAG: alpha/beta hydrolase [Caldilineaceae bacterium]